MAATVVLVGFEDAPEAEPEIHLCDPSGALLLFRTEIALHR